MLRGLCTFNMHSMWQEVNCWTISSINHLVKFWEKLQVRTLDLFRNFSSFFLKYLISKIANIRATFLEKQMFGRHLLSLSQLVEEDEPHTPVW